VNTQADFSFMAGKIPSDADCALSSQDGVKTGPDNENSAMTPVLPSLYTIFQPKKNVAFGRKL
jgi:hypothetical protein